MASVKQKAILNFKNRSIIEFIKSEIIQHRKLKVTGFGIFEVKKMKASERHNPYTGKTEHFPEYYKITFTPTKEFKEKLR